MYHSYTFDIRDRGYKLPLALQKILFVLKLKVVSAYRACVNSDWLTCWFVYKLRHTLLEWTNFISGFFLVMLVYSLFQSADKYVQLSYFY